MSAGVTADQVRVRQRESRRMRGRHATDLGTRVRLEATRVTDTIVGRKPWGRLSEARWADLWADQFHRQVLCALRRWSSGERL